MNGARKVRMGKGFHTARQSMIRFLLDKQREESERKERNKTIVTLYESGLFSQVDISEIMGISTNTVNRALKERD